MVRTAAPVMDLRGVVPVLGTGAYRVPMPSAPPAKVYRASGRSVGTSSGPAASCRSVEHSGVDHVPPARLQNGDLRPELDVTNFGVRNRRLEISLPRSMRMPITSPFGSTYCMGGSVAFPADMASARSCTDAPPTARLSSRERIRGTTRACQSTNRRSTAPGRRRVSRTYHPASAPASAPIHKAKQMHRKWCQRCTVGPPHVT